MISEEEKFLSFESFPIVKKVQKLRNASNSRDLWSPDLSRFPVDIRLQPSTSSQGSTRCFIREVHPEISFSLLRDDDDEQEVGLLAVVGGHGTLLRAASFYGVGFRAGNLNYLLHFDIQDLWVRLRRSNEDHPEAQLRPPHYWPRRPSDLSTESMFWRSPSRQMLSGD